MNVSVTSSYFSWSRLYIETAKTLAGNGFEGFITFVLMRSKFGNECTYHFKEAESKEKY